MNNLKEKLVKYFKNLNDRKNILTFVICSVTIVITMLFYALSEKSQTNAAISIFSLIFVFISFPLLFFKDKYSWKSFEFYLKILEFWVIIFSICITAFILMQLSTLTASLLLAYPDKVKNIATNILFILIIFVGMEGAVLFFSSFIILVYRYFENMTIFNSLKMSKKFVKKRIFAHLVSVLVFAVITSPILYFSNYIIGFVFINLFFKCIYFITIVDFVVFDIQQNIPIVKEKVDKDIERKKNTPKLKDEIKSIYYNEKKFFEESLKEKNINFKKKKNKKSN